MNAINTPALGDLAKAIVADFNGIRDEADLDAARVIGTEVALRYGDDDAAGFARIRDHGIWNDHPAVQAALAAIRICRQVLPGMPPVPAGAGPIGQPKVEPAAAELLLAEAPLPWRAETDDAASFNDTVEIWDGSGAYVAEIDLREYERESDGTTIGHRVAALIVETMNARQADATDAWAAHAELRATFEALGAALPWRTTGIVDGVLISASGRAVATIHVVDSLDDPRETALARLIANAVNIAAGFPAVATSQ